MAHSGSLQVVSSGSTLFAIDSVSNLRLKVKGPRDRLDTTIKTYVMEIGPEKRGKKSDITKTRLFKYIENFTSKN